MRVFLSDDSEHIRKSLKSLISDISEVEIVGEAANVAETMEGIRRTLPDAVILDLHLPDGSGMDILDKFKRSEGAPMFIIFTGYDYPQYRKQCFEAGADHFFVKSDDPRNLIGLLRKSATGPLQIDHF